MTARRGALVVAAFALAARLAVALWAATRFPPAADGVYYELLARRIAEGHGYTWAWPDGAVTYAAHYPVGYPALLAAAYAAFGSHAFVAMLLNALVGAAGSVAVYAILVRVRAATPRRAVAGGLVAALHPALVLYTPALMTEAIAATLLVVAVALATEAHVARAAPGGRGRGHAWAWAWRAAAGVALGVATLVRPQCIALAPLVGWLAVEGGGAGSVRRRLTSCALVTGLALACCAPWMARNCSRMDRCALVSVNGGWNLLIGVQTQTGAWAPVDVPAPCREVWAEAAKDDCFGRAARAQIAENLAAFVAAAPRKIAVTFDYFGAAPWYLHASNPAAFSERAKVIAGAVETLASRALLVGALLACARLEGARRRLRIGLAAVGAVMAFCVHGWGAYVALAAVVLALGPRHLGRASPVLPFTAALILATMITHATFFGAGRYGLVVVPFVALLAFLPPTRAGESARPLA